LPHRSTSPFPTLPPEVRDYEPAVALAGGADGLDVIRALVSDCNRVLAPGGWLVFEFGHGQEPGVRAAISAGPRLRLVRISADLQGIPRVAAVQQTP
jgi:release factor glutamine methyltransferase